MNTIVETPKFTRQVVNLWTLDEYEDFKVFIAQNPDAGQVIPGTGGVRKIRWNIQGIGKRGGARVIYYNQTRTETWLLAIYAKSNLANLPVRKLIQMRKDIDG